MILAISANKTSIDSKTAVYRSFVFVELWDMLRWIGRGMELSAVKDIVKRLVVTVLYLFKVHERNLHVTLF